MGEIVRFIAILFITLMVISSIVGCIHIFRLLKDGINHAKRERGINERYITKLA